MTSPGLATFPPSRRRSPARKPGLARAGAATRVVRAGAHAWRDPGRHLGRVVQPERSRARATLRRVRPQYRRTHHRPGRMQRLHRRGGHPPCARRATRGAGRHHPHPAPLHRAQPQELVQFYQDVSDATDIPICVYNWPRGCVVDMDVELLEELSDIDHVVAIKNSTPDFGMFLQGAYRLRHGSATSTCPPRRWAPIWRRWASATA